MKNLLVVLGPTGIGKTNLSIEVAQLLGTEIISADSRQIYRELAIGTAIPSPQQLHTVKHHFIQSISIHQPLNASHFEQLVLVKLDELFKTYDNVVMTGGSMMYIDVVCHGIDDLPNIDPAVRSSLLVRFASDGLEPLRHELKIVDPAYYMKADLKNHKRVIHALEVYYMTGKPYSSFLTRQKAKRDFNIIKVGLNTDRSVLYDRINKRVDQMVEQGLVEEARNVYPYKHLNSLNTVGYRELFAYFDGELSLDAAIEQIKANSRKYARKQLTWFRKDKLINWFDVQNEKAIFEFIKQEIEHTI